MFHDSKTRFRQVWSSCLFWRLGKIMTKSAMKTSKRKSKASSLISFGHLQRAHRCVCSNPSGGIHAVRGSWEGPHFQTTDRVCCTHGAPREGLYMKGASCCLSGYHIISSSGVSTQPSIKVVEWIPELSWPSLLLGWLIIQVLQFKCLSVKGPPPITLFYFLHLYSLKLPFVCLFV